MAAAYPPLGDSPSRIFPLTEILDEYPLSLVDNSFLCQDGDFSRDLYETRFPDELSGLEERIKEMHLQWNWRLEHLIRHPNAYTLPAIIEEIKPLEEHIRGAHRMHSFYLNQARWGKAVRRKNKRDRPSGFEKRMEKAKDLERDFDPHRPNEGLIYLNCLLNCVRKTIAEFKRYSGRIEPIPHRINASENDYLLIEAAISYARKDPSSRVALLTRDSHFPQIIRTYNRDGGKKVTERVHIYQNGDNPHQVKLWEIREF